MLRHCIFIVLCFTAVCARAEDRTILVLGDSLSAGYGIDVKDGWVSLLKKRLEKQGYNYRVINASISGDTTRGARERLDKELKTSRPEIGIIELGGNDGLRGLSLEEMRSNLAGIIAAFSRAGSRVLLLPIQLPPNYGPVYNERFRQIYRELAANNNVVLGRFILEGIADKPQLMQDDGIHPRTEAQMMMLDNVWPQLQPMLSRNREHG
jgi:acyl-CoA thioesterase-1